MSVALSREQLNSNVTFCLAIYPWIIKMHVALPREQLNLKNLILYTETLNDFAQKMK